MGETPIRAIAESRSWRSQLYWIGVWPDGAHVRRRTGCSMKPLSSEKISGLRSRFALFLFAATRVCASARWPLRCVPVLDARVSDMSNRVREVSSIHAPNGIRRRMSWRLLPQHGDRSIGPFGSRSFVGLSASRQQLPCLESVGLQFGVASFLSHKLRYACLLTMVQRKCRGQYLQH